VTIESKYADSTYYQWLEKTWRLHQLALAVLLFSLGGWSFVVWGVFVRVSVSIVGHWTITYFCHNPGHGNWRVVNAAVQASNIPGLGILTYGECWHNNHHAFPESARIGLESGQCDPAYRFIEVLGFAGLASNIGQPRPEDQREDLRRTNRASR
jgi:stearoyl-CoA desaturase (delta-9 desaturase)